MSRLIPLTATALALALALPQVVAAQDHGNGHGKDKDKGGSHASESRGNNGNGRGGDDDRGRNNDRGRGNDDAPRPQALREVRQAERSAERRQDRRNDRDEDRHEDRREDRREDRNRPVVIERDGRDFVVLRRAANRGLIAGCPPGLAKKNNGCLPPGQARRAERRDYDLPRHASLWGPRADGWDYRYRDGYLYRVTPQGSLLGYLPVLGGALSPGSTWPGQYQWEPVPTYYSQYYGLNNQQEYRYADGALYGVNPRTQAITQVAALLTGQDWNVGQRMPAGYDVYNLPYDVRSQYADTPSSLYRYNDGRVYQVDPKTRLVQAVIQLLT